MTTKRGLIIACTLLFVLIVGGASRALAQSSSSGAGTAPTATTTPVGSTTPTTQPTTQPNDAASTFAGIVDGGADTPKIVVKSPDGIATPSVSDTSSSSQSTVSINTPTLDDPASIPPTHHIFTESRIPWFDTADDLPRHKDSGPDA